MSNTEKEDDVFSVLRDFTRRRLTRVAMYSLLAIGSVISFFAPSQVLLDQTSSELARIWSLGFAVAALTCFIGSLFDRWIFEYIMLPLLSSTLVVFGGAMIAQAQAEDAAKLLPYFCFFVAFALGLIARWRDVQSLLRLTTVRVEDEVKV